MKSSSIHCKYRPELQTIWTALHILCLVKTHADVLYMFLLIIFLIEGRYHDWVTTIIWTQKPDLTRSLDKVKSLLHHQVRYTGGQSVKANRDGVKEKQTGVKKTKKQLKQGWNAKNGDKRRTGNG